jgi:hypothetical protein
MPSPALVISLIALFVALGSGAYAASKIGTSDIQGKAVTGAKIAKDAIKSSKVKDEKLKGKDLKGETIEGEKIASETIEGEKIASETITRGKLDSSAKTYWAVVSNPPGANDATIVRSSDPGFGIDEGTYVGVDFGKDVSQCTWPVTRGNPGSTVEVNGYAEVHLGQTASEVRVATRTSEGVITDGNFHLMVKC